MGVSTNGQICFGIDIGENYHSLPWWDTYDIGIESWWEEEVLNCPIKRSDYEEFGDWYDAKNEWEENNPNCPVSLVNTCSNDYEMYILAVPSTVISCRRGYPTEITKSVLEVDEEDLARFKKFCNDYNIEYVDDELKWYLSSYWG